MVLDSVLKAGILGAFVGAAVATIVFVAIALYIYYALVLYSLAKKMKHAHLAWLAWIPLANLALIPILAKKHWAWVFMFLVPIANIVFFILWTWKIYDLRKFPAWLSLMPVLFVIPFLGWIAFIANLAIWGVVAWKK